MSAWEEESLKSIKRLINESATSERFKWTGCIKFAMNLAQILGQGRQELEFWREVMLVEQHLKSHETAVQTVIELKRSLDRHAAVETAGWVIALINASCPEPIIEHQWIIVRLGTDWYLMQAFSTDDYKLAPVMIFIARIGEHMENLLRLSVGLVAGMDGC
jgi:hypothetical protein